MKSNKTVFFISLFCVIVLMVAATFVFKQICPQFVTSLWPFQIMFFAAVNVVMFFLTLNVREKNDASKMTYLSMISTMVKLIAFLVILVIYAIKFPEDRTAFAVSFLLYYVCFTCFETFVKVKINN